MAYTHLKYICVLFLISAQVAYAQESSYFKIKVIDDQSGRGVPLVELGTVNGIAYYTDSQGIVAFDEPGLMGKNVWFSVKSHGYYLPVDGFGFHGKAFVTKPGGYGEIKIKRVNRAERLYRITGQGIYVDSMRVGNLVPIKEPLLQGEVMGQDSALACIYKKKIYWFWGDTGKPNYPLGLFHVAGAVSYLPGQGGLDPNIGIDLHYFVDENGSAKAMCPFEGEGVVWLDGPVIVKDHNGCERMLAHYARMKNLGEMLEHGLSLYNDKKEIFEKLRVLDMQRQWECPRGHPVKYSEDGENYFVFPSPYATVRVKADFESVSDPNAYEAFTCFQKGTRYNKTNSLLNRNSGGKLIYQWQQNTDPLGATEERELLKAGMILPHEVRYLPISADTNDNPLLINGSLNWNAYRKKWIVISVETFGKSSGLGEIWYSEADAITGPWNKCIKVITHNDYSFYNPVHHAFFDQQGGRVIYFEGTYAAMFSGTKQPTPRYEYNQIMYKLDLACIK